jgi:hypothetical protein
MTKVPSCGKVPTLAGESRRHGMGMPPTQRIAVRSRPQGHFVYAWGELPAPDRKICGQAAIRARFTQTAAGCGTSWIFRSYSSDSSTVISSTGTS